MASKNLQRCVYFVKMTIKLGFSNTEISFLQKKSLITEIGVLFEKVRQDSEFNENL